MSKPATPETFPNGATIVWLGYPWNAYGVTDAYGNYHGMRRSLDAARESRVVAAWHAAPTTAPTPDQPLASCAAVAGGDVHAGRAAGRRAADD